MSTEESATVLTIYSEAAPGMPFRATVEPGGSWEHNSGTVRVVSPGGDRVGLFHKVFAVYESSVRRAPNA